MQQQQFGRRRPKRCILHELAQRNSGWHFSELSRIVALRSKRVGQPHDQLHAGRRIHGQRIEDHRLRGVGLPVRKQRIDRAHE